MLDLLSRLDTAAFHFLNLSIANPVFDVLLPFMTDLNRQRAVLVGVLLLLIWMLVRGSKPVRTSAVLLVLTIIISDQLSSSVLKFWFERPRPCHELLDVRLLVGCGSGFSFPSSHAVNNFAGAIVLSYFLPRGMPWLFGFAAIVAFSRIYVGVHYPSDVIGGAIIGLACGGVVLAAYEIMDSVYRHWMQKRRDAAARQERHR